MHIVLNKNAKYRKMIDSISHLIALLWTFPEIIYMHYRANEWMIFKGVEYLVIRVQEAADTHVQKQFTTWSSEKHLKLILVDCHWDVTRFLFTEFQDNIHYNIMKTNTITQWTYALYEYFMLCFFLLFSWGAQGSNTAYMCWVSMFSPCLVGFPPGVSVCVIVPLW